MEEIIGEFRLKSEAILFRKNVIKEFKVDAIKDVKNPRLNYFTIKIYHLKNVTIFKKDNSWIVSIDFSVESEHVTTLKGLLDKSRKN